MPLKTEASALCESGAQDTTSPRRRTRMEAVDHRAGPVVGHPHHALHGKSHKLLESLSGNVRQLARAPRPAWHDKAWMRHMFVAYDGADHQAQQQLSIEGAGLCSVPASLSNRTCLAIS